MSSAIRPPIMKNTNDETMYMIPICFASVVRSSRENAEPLTCWRTGQGRVTIGFGSTVVTSGLRMSRSSHWAPPGAQGYLAGRIVLRTACVGAG